MRVRMLEDRAVVVDGINKIDAKAGESYEMGDGIAQSLIDQAAAEPSDGEQFENKDAGDAAETQAQKPARGRGKQKPTPQPEDQPGDAPEGTRPRRSSRPAARQLPPMPPIDAAG